MASDFLPPLEVKPHELLSLTDQSTQRWETLVYRVFRGQTVVTEQRLPEDVESVRLSEEPGPYTISLVGESKHGQLSTVLRVVVLP